MDGRTNIDDEPLATPIATACMAIVAHGNVGGCMVPVTAINRSVDCSIMLSSME